MQKKKEFSLRSIKALQWLNFFMADVRDGLGPYLAIFLLTSQHWNPAEIGVALTVMGVATLIMQTPAGAFIDFTRHKCLTIALASVVIAAASIGVAFSHYFWSIVSFQALMGVASAFIGPAIAGITLGVVGPSYFSRQVGKNEAYNHLGNIFAALIAGGLGYFFSTGVVFYLTTFTALMALVSMYFIKREDIDNQLARGFTKENNNNQPVSGFSILFKSKTLLLFTLSIFLFHFANAAMLPLLGQSLAGKDEHIATLFMSASIIVAQLVMVPAAIFVGKKANSWGRKKIFLIAFAVLPIRGLLYTFSDNPFYLVSVQMLDGVAAGIFGALFLIVIADLTEGTGRFNVTQGAVSTFMGIGAALSSTVAGGIVVHKGYDVAFITLAAIAAVAFLLFAFFVPETKNWADRRAAEQ
ncbi:MAG: MFS transporter [Gammaproteobacteria bacterium]|nr:MFS transporter [Gammaproteobacteria bacterium]